MGRYSQVPNCMRGRRIPSFENLTTLGRLLTHNTHFKPFDGILPPLHIITTPPVYDFLNIFQPPWLIDPHTIMHLRVQYLPVKLSLNTATRSLHYCSNIPPKVFKLPHIYPLQS